MNRVWIGCVITYFCEYLRPMCSSIRYVVHIECVLSSRIASRYTVTASDTGWLGNANVILGFGFEVD